MRLATLLAELSDADLERLAIEHVRTDEKLARPQLCNFLEGALRSFRFISSFIVNRQPPTFSMLTVLLESAGYQRPIEGFRDAVMAETRRLVDLLEKGEMLARDRQLHLYRGCLYEARRNDLDVNTSESAILAVLRRELRITQVEHFLIEHHPDLREFWDREQCYEHEEHALRSAGIVFHSSGRVLIPEDVAPVIWQTLGIDMPKESARRLFGFLSNADLGTILDGAGSRTSGSKEQRMERVILEHIQPRTALQSVGLATLKDICRETDASSSGNKDELIDRVVSHFAQGRDQREAEPVEVRLPEPRRLPQSQFETMFNALLHQELSDILRHQPELRQTGTKEMRIRTLWEAQLSEVTLLGELMSRQLEDILHRLGLRMSGSKVARIERIIEHFDVTAPREADRARSEEPAPSSMPHRPTSPEVAANQAAFRQRAANPHTSLQPWLETVMSAEGMIRCDAIDGAVPTTQLKNTFSHAPNAANGLLVVLLADEPAYVEAREALIDQWMANAEWPKSVACVALAHPIGNPTIHSLVERLPNPWSTSIRTMLFPDAEIVSVAKTTNESNGPCEQCRSELPTSARFCPSCGTPVSAAERVDSTP